MIPIPRKNAAILFRVFHIYDSYLILLEILCFCSESIKSFYFEEILIFESTNSIYYCFTL